MAADSSTLYKLIILYMLDNLDFPMTNSQISEFVLGKGYTDYFTLQQTIYDLEASELILPENVRNSTRYTITESGRETISMFESMLPSSIKEDIRHFFEEKKYQLRKEIDISADYYPVGKEYMVKCLVKEKKSTLLELRLNVVSKEQAIHICDHWQEKSEDVYHYLVQKLLLEDSVVE
jgi:DNA-binding PadR family transcriptional regulator